MSTFDWAPPPTDLLKPRKAWRRRSEHLYALPAPIVMPSTKLSLTAMLLSLITRASQRNQGTRP